MLEFGIIGVAYAFIILLFAMRSQIPFRTIAVVILAVTWLNSFPAGWPPFWVLVGIMMSPHFRSVGTPGGVNVDGVAPSPPPTVPAERLR
jgi:hypothetical protein